MSNVPRVTTIYGLADREDGLSAGVAREIGMNRETVGRYLRLAKGAKPAISAPGVKEPVVCRAVNLARRGSL